MGTETQALAGIGRRDLIKRAAAVGAAAWTAPLVLESVTNPAGALTPGPCTKYAVKLTPTGGCASYCFENGSGYTWPANDAYWAGSCSRPTGCSPSANTTKARTVGMTAKMPSVSTVSFFNSALGRNIDYKRVILPSGCYFSSTTGWQIGGRYGTSDPGNIWLQASSSCMGGPTTGTSIGCYQEGGSTAWVITYSDALVTSSPHNALRYIYLKFCCSS